LSVLQRRVDNPDELRDALEDIRQSGLRWFTPMRAFAETYAESFGLAKRHVCVVEEFVRARSQHAIEGWSDREGHPHIWAISDNHYFSSDDAPLDYNGIPTRLGPDQQARLTKAACDIVARHGIRNGFWNVEMWVLPDGQLKITEVNGRAISSMSPLYHAVYGQDQYETMLRLACSDANGCRAPPASTVRVGGMFSIATFGSGRVDELVHLKRVAEARRWAGVASISLMQRPDYVITWRQTGRVFCLLRAYITGPDFQTIEGTAADLRGFLVRSPEMSPGARLGTGVRVHQQHALAT
jgi:hypothetical protein